MLRLENVCKFFGGIKAVNNISYGFKEGNIYAIVGPNGAGKTTLLNIINGFIFSDYGRVYINGNDVTRDSAYFISKRGVGRLFQQTWVYPKMTCIENLLLSKQVYGEENPILCILRYFHNVKQESDHRNQALKVLKSFNLASNANTLAKNLSFSQGKILSLCKLTFSNFNIFLLDEPFTGVDLLNRGKIINIIKELSRSDKLVILVEHEIESVQKVADYVIFMSGGKIIKDGPPNVVFSDVRILKEYIGFSNAV